MKVLYYTNIPSPYRILFFNELGKKCELTVLFELDSSLERDSEWMNYSFENFEGIILKGTRLTTDSAWCPGIIKYLSRDYDEIIVSVLSSPTAFCAVSYLKLHKIDYSFEGDGGFATITKGIKFRLKKYIIGSAKKIYSSSDEFDKYCLSYGAKKNVLHRYHFTSVPKINVLSKPLGNSEKQEIRKSLGIFEKGIVLAVGQFIKRKGFDILIESAKEISSDIGIYIIGGKATEEYNSLCERYNLKNVHFLDFMPTNMLNQYYLAADVFVLPTREDIWGLVINEAMSKGLPVISTNKCIAALELIKDGDNGFIVETENAMQLSDSIMKIMSDAQTREKMSEKALSEIREKYTIENMVDDHLNIMQKTKTTLCCTLVQEQFESQIKDLSVASNRFLNNFLKYYKKNSSISILSYLGIQFAEQLRSQLKSSEEESEFRFFFKKDGWLKVFFNYLDAVKSEIKTSDIVICYNVVHIWMFTPLLCKKLGKKSVLILADYTPAEGYTSMARKVYAKAQLLAIRKFDYVVGLSHMTKRLLSDRQKFICVEGGIDKDVFEYFNDYEPVDKNKVTLRYAGVLEPVTGVDLLIDAMNKIHNNNVELVISGKGSLEKLVLEAHKQDPRIKYMGCVLYDDYLLSLKDSDILINPRNMNLVENENNFPSKIMEYLATGKPIVSTKFQGWNRFEENIIFCESNSDDICETLKLTIENLSEHKKRYRTINRKKSVEYLWEKQIDKIWEFVFEED